MKIKSGADCAFEISPKTEWHTDFPYKPWFEKHNQLWPFKINKTNTTYMYPSYCDDQNSINSIPSRKLLSEMKIILKVPFHFTVHLTKPSKNNLFHGIRDKTRPHSVKLLSVLFQILTVRVSYHWHTPAKISASYGENCTSFFRKVSKSTKRVPTLGG
jgi:hypothetical protein